MSRSLSLVSSADLAIGLLGPPMVMVHASSVTAPLAGTVLADTGPIRRGMWLFFVRCFSTESNSYRIEHRNALNTATLFESLINSGTEPQVESLDFFDVGQGVSDSHRVRVVNINTGSAGSTYQVTMFGWLLELPSNI